VSRSVPRVVAVSGWALLVAGAAVWLALVEVFWLPLRVGGVLVPLSLPAAVAGNLLLADQAYRRTGSRLVGLLPAAAWAVVVAGAAIRRPEGDLVIVGTGALGIVGLAFLLCGAAAASFAVARVLGGPPAGRTSSARGVRVPRRTSPPGAG
jgi:hypothetical protein